METVMKIQHLILILFLAAYCTVSAQMNDMPANTNTPSLKPLGSPPRYMVYTDSQREPKGSITTWSATNSGDTIIFYLHNSISGSNWVVNLRLSDGQESQANTIDEREPKGSHNVFFDVHEKYGNTNVTSKYNPNIYVYLHNSVSGSNWIMSYGPHMQHAITLPYIFKDVDTGITFEVEADGRHVSATDMYGALLWYRDPFADAHMEYYRTINPQIVSFTVYKRKPSDDWTFVERVLSKKGVSAYIAIGFNSSQAGFMDMTTGDFHFTGQL
jgi:hypothetical protein